MAKKTKKEKKVNSWDPVKSPVAPGMLVDSRSGQSKFVGRGRRKDTPLHKFESYEDQKKMRELYKQWKNKPKGMPIE